MEISEIFADIPEQFRNITLAYSVFYVVASPLEQLEGKDPVSKHIVIATSLGHLVEVCERSVLRFTELSWKDIKNIVVHHSFSPLQRYIVLLRQCSSAIMLLYDDFKKLYEWENIVLVESTDTEGRGMPSLSLTDISGHAVTLSSVQLSSLSLSSSQLPETEEKGKADVAAALSHRLKGGMRHIEMLASQRRTKETFIRRKLNVMQSQLQGLASETSTLMPVLAVGGMDQECKEPSLPPVKTKTSVLNILSVRYKIVHDKWVIGINVVNSSERNLVCHPQLTLHISEGSNTLSYTTKILKVVQRKVPIVAYDPSDKPQTFDTRLSVEKLYPPVLRPKRKVSILGVCSIPDFTESATVVCSGLVTYTVKALSPEETQDLVSESISSQQLQLSFEPIVLSACDLQTHHITIEKNLKLVGVPFTSVALVGGSVYNQVTFTSISSSLENFVTWLDRAYNVVKVVGLSDMYCLYPEDVHPLRFSAITLLTVNSNKIDLGLYTRDDSHALLLIHSLKAILPPDVNFQAITVAKPVPAQDEIIRLQLFAKMKEASTYVMEGYENHIHSPKIVRAEEAKPGPSNKENDEFNCDIYSNERKLHFDRKEKVMFSATSYRDWRKNLYTIQSEVDELYIKFLK
ncbi:hypothetical protein SK128_015915 [Halocaridina rubra]|uniref:Uncharacterized protein n=1 Tax=Halocaridina rubra TaxID=373956 RepID=A0AAN8XDL8_HALRR